MDVPQTIAQRRELTESRLSLLVNDLAEAGAQEIASGRACVYATGSLGRGEMSERSDLDIFILRDRSLPSPLTNLDEIRLKARLIEVCRKEHYPDFSGDGEYVHAHDIKNDLIGKLGTREDDYANVFTARLLLLLESRSILGEEIYGLAVDSVIAEYWRDYPRNSRCFLPVFLINDILRFWKTLCLNYEERTGGSPIGRRRLYNYKLKHSRLLTCYSGVIYLQSVLDRDGGTVSPEAALQMVSSSPTRRLEHVARSRVDLTDHVQQILERYSVFLDTCDADKSELESRFSEAGFKNARFAEAKEFGDRVFSLLHAIGEGTELFRYLAI
ncbi:MAG: nucleotidyltransferase domain-containing protein [Pseudomonadota bacterium]